MPIPPDEHPAQKLFSEWMAVHAIPHVDQLAAWQIWLAAWNACAKTVLNTISRPTDTEIRLQKR